jgi:hypothetical protein
LKAAVKNEWKFAITGHSYSRFERAALNSVRAPVFSSTAPLSLYNEYIETATIR